MQSARLLWKPTLVATLIVAYLLLGRSYAGNGAPDIDDSPLRSPAPVCFSMRNPREVISSLEKGLEEVGYTVSRNPARKGEALAVKIQKEGAQDKFLMWLARDIDDSSKVNVFVEYGRFENILGKGLKRVVIGEPVREERIAEFMKISTNHHASCQTW